MTVKNKRCILYSDCYSCSKCIHYGDCVDTDDNYDDNYEEDYDEGEECYEEEDYSSEPGDEKLPSQEEDLAVSIAADIDDGKYSISTIVGLYSQDIIDRVKYLID